MSIKENVRIIQDYFSGERAENIVSGVINFNRVQASTGYRAAANYCVDVLRDSGIEAEVLSYTANDRTSCYTVDMFKEWDCKGAWLDLVSPEYMRLADYDVNAMSLLQRSWGADYRDHDLDVVYLNRGKEMDKYDDVDLKGKMIFVTGEYWEYAKWAVKEKGAVGVIIDNMPDLDGVKQRSRLYDATNATSISGRRLREDMKMFGFVMTPRRGDMLKKLCEDMEREYMEDNTKLRYPSVRAYVDACCYDGHLEDVTAFIPGETDEEIIISAHLCHIKACANDNSSGVAASMEAMKTIRDLIDAGRLKVPRRGIRLLLVPELSGTYAYLSNMTRDQISKIKAGVNLDMVGAPQRDGNGTVMVGDVPDSAPSFVTDVAAIILDEIQKEVDFFGDGQYLSTFNAELKDYMVGSDHYVFSDPTIGVPSVAISQWPDSVYHTSSDTIDNIDGAMLKRTGTLCAAYAYAMATLSTEDLPVILNKMRWRFIDRLSSAIGQNQDKYGNERLHELWRVMEYHERVYEGRTRDMGRFFSGEEGKKAEALIAKQLSFLKVTARDYFQQHLSISGIKGYEYVPRMYEDKYKAVPERTFVAPLAEGKQFEGELKVRQDEIAKKYPDYFFIYDYIINWIDSKRSIGEIAGNFLVESGIDDIEFVYDYIMLLRDAGYVVLKDGEGGSHDQN